MHNSIKTAAQKFQFWRENTFKEEQAQTLSLLFFPSLVSPLPQPRLCATSVLSLFRFSFWPWYFPPFLWFGTSKAPFCLLPTVQHMLPCPPEAKVGSDNQDPFSRQEKEKKGWRASVTSVPLKERESFHNNKYRKNTALE